MVTIGEVAAVFFCVDALIWMVNAAKRVTANDGFDRSAKVMWVCSMACLAAAWCCFLTGRG